MSLLWMYGITSILYLVVCFMMLWYAVPSKIGQVILGVYMSIIYTIITVMFFASLQ